MNSLRTNQNYRFKHGWEFDLAHSG